MFVFKKSKCSSRPRLPLPKAEVKVAEEKPEIVRKAAPKKQKPAARDKITLNHATFQKSTSATMKRLKKLTTPTKANRTKLLTR